MIRSVALKMAIDALQKKSEYILFTSDSKHSDDKRIEIAQGNSDTRYVETGGGKE